jgi:hypothetical protein
MLDVEQLCTIRAPIMSSVRLKAPLDIWHLCKRALNDPNLAVGDLIGYACDYDVGRLNLQLQVSYELYTMEMCKRVS